MYSKNRAIIENVNSIPLGAMFYESHSVCEKKSRMINGRVLHAEGH